MLGWMSRRRSDLSMLADRIDALVEAIPAPAQTEQRSDSTSERLTALETEFQGLQLRQEQLAEECLRHLRKASQRLKRAEQVAEDEELGESMAVPPMNPQLDFPEQAEQDDHQWAQEMIRKRGEIPL